MALPAPEPVPRCHVVLHYVTVMPYTAQTCRVLRADPTRLRRRLSRTLSPSSRVATQLGSTFAFGAGAAALPLLLCSAFASRAGAAVWPLIL